MFLLNK